MSLRQATSGFSLLEVIVSISLLSVCGVMIMDSANNCMWMGKRLDDKARAITHARSVMERLLSDTTVELSGLKDAKERFEGELGDGFYYRAIVSEYPTDKNKSQDQILLKFVVRIFQNEPGKSMPSDLRMDKGYVYELKSVRIMCDARRRPAVPKSNTPFRKAPTVEFPGAR